MNILILSSRIPYPLTAGFRIRIYNLAKYLKNDGHTVDLMYLGTVEENTKFKSELEKVFSTIYCIPFSKKEAVIHLAKCIFDSHLPLQVQLYQNKRFKNKFLELENKYDLVIGNHIRTSEYLKMINPNKVILDMHDAISYNYKNAIKVSKGIKKIIYRLEYKRVLSYECNIVNAFPKVVMISDKDRKWLESQGANVSNVTLIPVSVRDDIQDTKREYEQDENAICFLGKMSYQPNVDAVLWFAKNVFPELLTTNPDLTFYVLGIEPTPEIKALSLNQHIKVTGFMDNPYQIMARVKATIVPILNGAGIQNKVLESMLIGTPVIASSIAADGIQAQDGIQLLIAKNKDEFVQKTNIVLKSVSMRKQLGIQGKNYITEHFTWDALWKKWKKLIGEE